MSGKHTYIATFAPQAWINDYAVEVDAEGPQEWDCTVYATDPQPFATGGTTLDYLARLDSGAKASGNLDDSLDGEWGVLDNDDVFKDDPAAPEWIRNWRGPFDIRIRRVEDGRTHCTACGEDLTDTQWYFDPCASTEDGSHQAAS